MLDTSSECSRTLLGVSCPNGRASRPCIGGWLAFVRWPLRPLGDLSKLRSVPRHSILRRCVTRSGDPTRTRSYTCSAARGPQHSMCCLLPSGTSDHGLAEQKARWTGYVFRFAYCSLNKGSCSCTVTSRSSCWRPPPSTPCTRQTPNAQIAQARDRSTNVAACGRRAAQGAVVVDGSRHRPGDRSSGQKRAPRAGRGQLRRHESWRIPPTGAVTRPPNWSGHKGKEATRNL
jgi:hypothetical protein